MIARAFLGQNPFEVWGDGTQIRNGHTIEDIVEGTILAGEKINDGTAINLGTMERIRVIDCAKNGVRIHRTQSRDPAPPDMPTGRQLASLTIHSPRTLGWDPKVIFREGSSALYDWYYATRRQRGMKRIFTRHIDGALRHDCRLSGLVLSLNHTDSTRVWAILHIQDYPIEAN